MQLCCTTERGAIMSSPTGNTRRNNSSRLTLVGRSKTIYSFTTMMLLLLVLSCSLFQTTEAILPTMEIDIYWADEYHGGISSSSGGGGRNTKNGIKTDGDNYYDDETDVSSATKKRSARLSGGGGGSSSSSSSSISPQPFSTMYASQAWFGIYPPMKHSATNEKNKKGYIPVLPPSDDVLLCHTNYKESDASMYPDTTNIMMVGRGTCSFEQKAQNAQTLGASAIIIYGTLGSRYSYNTTTQSIIYPQALADYDCSMGEADISLKTLNLINGYDNTTNDSQLTGRDSLCAQANPNFFNTCNSGACLLTGMNSSSDSSQTKMKACCAWDLHIPLYNDPNLEQVWYDLEMSQVSIPAVYVTLEQGHELLELMGGNSYGSSPKIVLELYERWRPTYNWSAVVVWGVGVFVAWLSAYLSASDYRGYTKWASSSSSRKQDDDFAHDEEEDTGVVAAVSDNSSNSQYQRVDSPGNTRQRRRGGAAEEDDNPESQTALMTELIPSPSSGVKKRATANNEEEQPSQGSTETATTTSSYAYGEETVELTWHHAVSFLIFSSCSLFVLFFFKIYSFLKVMYGIGCSGALSQVVVAPLLELMFKKIGKSHYSYQHVRPTILFHCLGEPVTPVDLLAVLISYSIGITWIIIGFTVKPDPSVISFYWMVQDVFGACMCITFLGVIRLNNIKVATILLLAAFVYDIFFVFVTPLLFHGKSVMITVATSGGPPTADPTFCEKYPTEQACQGGQPLPMLFAIPRLFDYQGGSSLLGLGDIVLPGLLLSFACRLDHAKQLVAGVGTSRTYLPSPSSSSRCGYLSGSFISKCYTCMCCCFTTKTYFGPCVIAYAIGLMMANVAVYVMQMGQPALLYLVPMCLGTFCYKAYQLNELSEVWNTPQMLEMADRIVHPAPVEQQQQQEGEGGTSGDEGNNNRKEGTTTNNNADEMSAMAYAASSNRRRSPLEDNNNGHNERS